MLPSQMLSQVLHPAEALHVILTVGVGTSHSFGLNMPAAVMSHQSTLPREVDIAFLAADPV